MGPLGPDPVTVLRENGEDQHEHSTGDSRLRRLLWIKDRCQNGPPGARSSMDRATGFYPVGWGFESLRARFS